MTEGQALKLSCTLSKENCQVTWLKDDQEIAVGDGEEASHFVATNDGRSYRLEVKESKMSDAGAYTIKVEDKQQSCQVVITGKIEVFILLHVCSQFSPLQKHQSTSSFPWAIRLVWKERASSPNFMSN